MPDLGTSGALLVLGSLKIALEEQLPLPRGSEDLRLPLGHRWKLPSLPDGKHVHLWAWLQMPPASFLEAAKKWVEPPHVSVQLGAWSGTRSEG
ncbi:unnamed protein product [Rangifer tarandus platyrhynchus]|uniref:Uncharacterized protein n=1 Tax=Rangifer tarandus platyrhynchus TaxID=3082113 RepID=A0ABN9A0B1_RANTA|nr:unnamed protein product [Rangifer tarandus platyrhynchus]